MKFTGERFIPTEQGAIRLEHYHRYALVLDIVKGKKVLDIACGEGYGSSMIARSAHSVIGVDISHEAVEHASKTYANQSNLRFLCNSASSVDLPDASFDVVVSFETIEHLTEQQEMLAELRRVLKPDGVLIMSSPNRPVYSDAADYHNEFHVKELDFQEFDEILRSQFGAVQYYGQRLSIGSTIQPLNKSCSAYAAWQDDGNILATGSGYLTDPVYFLAVCASTQEILPTLDASIVHPTSTDLIKHYVGFAKWAQSLDAEVEQLRRHIASLDQQIASLNTEVASLDNEVAQRGQWAINLQNELTAAQRQITELTQSNSWRLTRPLREARRWVVNPKGQAKRYARMALTVAKRVYFALPLSPETQAMHRRFATKHMGWLLKAIRSAQQTPEIQPLPFPVTEPIDLTFQEELDLAKSITLDTSATPLVSVIIPIYGQCNYTLLCLASIAKHAPSIPYEVIVVDDYSPDHSREIIKHVANVKFIENPQNQGFIRSCNIGAKAATGEYVCFLNNDTQVAPGWLEELYRTFIEFPGTGLSGSKLVYPNGVLQEAGGILWQDGSAWNFGRNQDPRLPIYNYARETDYCSGASIMVPAQLFKELGGFDEHYLPAYCEDSDLALKIRSRGYRVIYQPLSVIVHFEGITSGTDTTQGAKAYQVENSKKLFLRWKEQLASHQVSGVDVDSAKDRMAKRRVLVLDHCTPTPDQDAGSVSLYNIMMLLRDMDFQVTFIPEDNFLYVADYTPALQRAGIEALYSPWVQTVEQHLQEFGGRYDLVFLFRPTVVERNLSLVKKYSPQAKTLFYTHDLHYLRMTREAQLDDDAKKTRAAEAMKMREFAAIEAVDRSILVSTAERELLENEIPDARLAVFPLILDIPGTQTAWEQRKDIVFVGGFQHTPNIDAMLYFCHEVMPHLRSLLPGARLFVVGSKPPQEIQTLQSDDIIVTGFVDDLNSLLERVKVSVAPLRFGAGIKGKIGTALAAGLPTVATSLAAEGMGLTDEENILIADEAEDFAKAIARLYNDEQLWNHLSKAGIGFAEKAWGARAAWQGLAEILDTVRLTPEPTRHPLHLFSQTRAH